MAAVFLGAALALPQAAKAEGGFTVAGINSALPAWSQTAKAEESSQPRGQIADDSALSALTSYAQQINAPQAAGAKTAQASQFDDRTFAALKSFAQSMGSAQPASLKGQTKVAEADNLLDWLSQPKQEAAPAAKPPKGKAAKAKGKYVAPVEAHFVGDKVCAGCHATQIAEFKKTLMGRISITQPAQVRLRELPRSGLGARGGRRRPRRRRHLVVRGGRSAQRGRKERRSVSPAMSAAIAPIGLAASTKSVAWPA